ncbi:hypothetical protein V3C99_018978, partial [Haemonchus contortus]
GHSMPYLDHAGAALPSEQQLKEAFDLALKVPLANPHSHHMTAATTHSMVQDARLRVLEHFDVTMEEYAVVFTANATHALRLVADNFAFNERSSSETRFSTTTHGKGSIFAYLRDSHNSVVGMREVVKDKVDGVVCADACENLLVKTECSLFAMTAMSNFCGRKYDLHFVAELERLGWWICLDAASLVSTSPLSLREVRPHFVAISFYKMFGYPTGIDAIDRLRPREFAGGTVKQILSDEFYSVLRDNIEERLEHGTLNYYAICALTKGFDDLKRYGGIREISTNTMKIANEAFKMLSGKVHWNGKPAVRVYGWKDAKMQGPIVTFNLLRDDGSFTGYSEVAKMASLYGIDLRTGCFCNSGACQMYLEHSNDQLRHYFEGGKECGDSMDLMGGRPTGAVRVSFGRQSTAEDIDALEQMIDYCFLGVQLPIDIDSSLKITNYSAIVSRIVIYPVKSCRGIALDKGALTKTGFQYDRAFMIECCGTPLTQKRHQMLCKIITKLDSDKMLSLSSADDSTASVPVPLHKLDGTVRKNGIVCVNSVRTSECSPSASAWVTAFLGLPDCKLQRVEEDSDRSLSNDAPYLLVNEASISVLAEVVGLSITETIDRFRPNIVVKGIPPFLEDTANFVNIDNYRFEVTKKCTRCEMICVNQDTGVKDPQLLVALRNFRGRERMTFGIYVKQIGDETGEIRLNSKVHFE